jgi:phosphatidylserine decarboxylase
VSKQQQSQSQAEVTGLDYIKAGPQYLLPHGLLSQLMHGLTRSKITWWKNAFIRWFIRQYAVDMNEAIHPVATDYPDFNAFFTRALKPESRTIDNDVNSVISPVDGAISQLGDIVDGEIFQAKGKSFNLNKLLGGRSDWEKSFQGGKFITIYLSPKDYHRIHLPLAGTLTGMTYVPGRLFSVNPATTRAVPGLFARNERLVIHFSTAMGDVAVIMVGALFVASMETVWAGEITPPHGSPLAHFDYQGRVKAMAKAAEIGRFNMGSTVILLFQKNAVQWRETLKPSATLRLGEPIADALRYDKVCS